MPSKINIFVLIVLLVFSSCNSGRKQNERDIASRFSHIEDLIGRNLLNAAKIELDSIHILHPRAIDARRTARVLQDTILLRENRRTLAFCDSILPIKQHEVDSIRRNFRLEKDETYQTVGNFVHRSLRIEQNLNRNYLRAFVDENADFFLVSQFTGNNRINHTSVRVSVGSIFATTDTIPTSSPFNHSFADGGMHWEMVTFRNEAAREVPVFIAQYADQRIRIALTGDRNAVFYLTEIDRRALADTYNLWVAMKDVVMLEREIERATAMIQLINERHN